MYPELPIARSQMVNVQIDNETVSEQIDKMNKKRVLYSCSSKVTK